MFRAKNYYLFYVLFIFLFPFENCTPDDDQKYIFRYNNDYDENNLPPRLQSYKQCLPPTIKVFYSPVDKVSWRFLKYQIQPTLETVVGQFIHLLLYPIANCELRRVGYHLGDTENDHKPIICTSGPGETSLALEHYCAFATLTKGHTWGRDWGQREQKRNGMLAGVNYCLCTLKQAHLPADQRIEGCRKTVAQQYRNNIQNCLYEAKSWSEKAFKIYKNTTFGYYPYIVLKNTHTTEWDIKAITKFDFLMCANMMAKPEYCDRFR